MNKLVGRWIYEWMEGLNVGLMKDLVEWWMTIN